MGELAAKALQTENIEALFDQIMNDYGQDILQLTYSYVRNTAVAEDLTQEIFVKCYKALPDFEQRASVRTWLWRIAINHCKDHLRSWHVRNVMLTYEKEAEPASSTDIVEHEIIRDNEDQELKKAVLELPLKFREPIYLHYFEELSLKEIEKVTGVKVNTIKTRMRRALALLKERLGG
ncbi:MAG TPA: sigma-70 family RNA polymerase sigma factor [Bacillaceae bacterium]